MALGRQVDNERLGMIAWIEHFSDRTTAFLRFNSDKPWNKLPAGNL